MMIVGLFCLYIGSEIAGANEGSSEGATVGRVIGFGGLGVAIVGFFVWISTRFSIWWHHK